ncbi:uncharacterized protein LOC129788833 [Lutzomyia longipalpis]|nr:uncharacterized protein LOC129788833 [Lutzomyia longipalpis]
MCQVSDCCEILNHPAGMLDRDQRTAGHLRHHRVRISSLENCDQCLGENKKFANTSKCTTDSSQSSWSEGHPVTCTRQRQRPLPCVRSRRKFCGKVKDLCLFLIFLWFSLNCLTQVASKPIRLRRAMIDKKYTNCLEKIPKGREKNTNSLIDYNKLQSLVRAHKLQVNLAHTEIEHGIMSYISQVFHHTDSLEDFHKIWSWRNIDWLHGKNKMPKELGEDVSDEYKEMLCSKDWNKPDTLLTQFGIMYDKYHRLDVGISAIINYYETNPAVKNQSSILNFIKRLKGQLTDILKTLHDVLEALNYDRATFEASNSNTVPTEYVIKDKPDLDNWVILREYMNTLELHRVELCIIEKQMLGSSENCP